MELLGRKSRFKSRDMKNKMQCNVGKRTGDLERWACCWIRKFYSWSFPTFLPPWLLLRCSWTGEVRQQANVLHASLLLLQVTKAIVQLFPYWFLQSNRGRVQPSKRKPLPPLPSSEVAEEKIRVKALYDFLPREPCDLALKRAEEYLILERYNTHWWKARDHLG